MEVIARLSLSTLLLHTFQAAKFVSIAIQTRHSRISQSFVDSRIFKRGPRLYSFQIL